MGEIKRDKEVGKGRSRERERDRETERQTDRKKETLQKIRFDEKSFWR